MWMIINIHFSPLAKRFGVLLLLIGIKDGILVAMSRTYQPKKRKRARTHGFLKRMRKTGGQRVIKKRRQKGRRKLTV